MLSALFLFLQVGIAQELTITGKVTSQSTRESLPGVSISVKQTTRGTISDENGNYSLRVKKGEIVVFSFLGYQPIEQTITSSSQTLNVALSDNNKELNEVVVIGYGQVKKQDATGSVTAIRADEFKRGVVSTPQDLLMGKVSGVQITSNGGAPGSGSTIRIRGGSSLSASNDPLIVIDGVPLDNAAISGLSNGLNTINPNDIETFTILKDASATAIYGSRAANGVIIITTKQGKLNSALKVNYTGTASLSYKTKTIDVFSADEYRTLIKQRYGENSEAAKLLGTANTNWQNEILKTAFTQEHNLSVTGSTKNLPYRISYNYLDQDGILKTTNIQRNTASISLNPTFFNGNLKTNLNINGTYAKNRFADQSAITDALLFDPTKPVMDSSSPYLGYYAWTKYKSDGTQILDSNGNPQLNTLVHNPVDKLENRRDISTVKRSIGSLQLDYTFPFISGLRANLNLGYDYSKSNGTVTAPTMSALNYSVNGGGLDRDYFQKRENKLLNYYMNYVKDVKSIDSKFDLMAGYSWEHFYQNNFTESYNVGRTLVNQQPTYTPTEYYLISYFGRLNYTFKEKYLLTFTLRDDGTSRFAKGNRWGLFPSAAFAWRIKDESFLKDVDALSDLKLRMGYGITGQQNISTNNYPYLSQYTRGLSDAMYQFGNTFYNTLRPAGYDSGIKWEETDTYNMGLDYGVLNNRISGAVDVYLKKTKNLINTIPVPAGSNLTNQIMTNVGNMENRGIEFTVNAKPIDSDNISWDVSVNATYNKNKITKLTATNDPSYIGVYTGGITGGTGQTAQIQSVGYPMNSFFVYEQAYDANHKPIEGLYVDRNHDGVINSADLYQYKKAAPNEYFGFSSKLNYYKWEFSFTGRMQLGNYVYNNVAANSGSYSSLYNSGAQYLSNVSKNVLKTSFVNAQLLSDYYVQKASFLKMDNITLAYNFQNLFHKKIDAKVYGSVNNVFTITKYKGIDSEVDGGIDNNVYPRPRIVLFGLSLDF